MDARECTFSDMTAAFQPEASRRHAGRDPCPYEPLGILGTSSRWRHAHGGVTCAGAAFPTGPHPTGAAAIRAARPSDALSATSRQARPVRSSSPKLAHNRPRLGTKKERRSRRQRQTGAAGSGLNEGNGAWPWGRAASVPHDPTNSRQRVLLSTRLASPHLRARRRAATGLVRQRRACSSRTRRVRCSGSRSRATASISSSTSLPQGSPFAPTCSS